MEYLLKSEQETKKFAQKISEKVKSGDVLALYGDLGSGKTTFTRYLVDALGIDDRVQSPTFVIARKYSSDDLVVNHLDLYRLSSAGELEDIGLPEYFNQENAITLIEWPEIAESLLPKNTKKMEFEFIDEHIRRVKCTKF